MFSLKLNKTLPQNFKQYPNFIGSFDLNKVPKSKKEFDFLLDLGIKQEIVFEDVISRKYLDSNLVFLNLNFIQKNKFKYFFDSSKQFVFDYEKYFYNSFKDFYNYRKILKAVLILRESVNRFTQTQLLLNSPSNLKKFRNYEFRLLNRGKIRIRKGLCSSFGDCFEFKNYKFFYKNSVKLQTWMETCLIGLHLNKQSNFISKVHQNNMSFLKYFILYFFEFCLLFELFLKFKIKTGFQSDKDHLFLQYFYNHLVLMFKYIKNNFFKLSLNI